MVEIEDKNYKFTKKIINIEEGLTIGDLELQFMDLHVQAADYRLQNVPVNEPLKKKTF